MKIKPENILKALERYRKLSDDILKAKDELDKKITQIIKVLGFEVAPPRLRSIIKSVIEEYVFSKPSLDPDEFSSMLIEEIDNTIEDLLEDLKCIEGAEARMIFTIIERLKELRGKINELIKSKWNDILPLLKGTIRIRKRISRLLKERRELFGLEKGDPLTLESFVRFVYKCLKHAIEEEGVESE